MNHLALPVRLLLGLTLCLILSLPSPLASAQPAAERPATLLLITSEALAEAWQPFAQWKTRLGLSTQILTVQSIEDTYDGQDTQARIRAAVLEHIDQHGTRFIVLGGDSSQDAGHVPDRDTPHPMFGYQDIPTDLYYLSPRDWDANGNGVYGEWPEDRDAIDYTHPQATIGRVPVRTAEDVAAYTEKVIAYESRYPTADFATRMVYTCPEPHAYPKLQTSLNTLAEAWSQGEFAPFFANQTPWDQDTPGDYDLTPSHWAAMLNAGAVGKMHIHGHGHLPVWVLENHQTVDANTVNTLSHPDAYPVITTVSCFTGQFDAARDPSITESMLRHPQGGAIAIIAPSREGVPVFADRSDYQLMMTQGKMDGTTETLTSFWRLGLENQLTLGEAFAAAKATFNERAHEHPGYHWVQCELNLLGDPSLPIRSDNPITPNVTAQIDGDVIRIGTGQPGATVCLWGEGLYVVEQADEHGMVGYQVPGYTGEVWIGVSGANLNATITNVVVD